MKRTQMKPGGLYVVEFKFPAFAGAPATRDRRVGQVIEFRSNGRSVVSFCVWVKEWDRNAGNVHDTFAGRVPFRWVRKNRWREVSDVQIIRAATDIEVAAQHRRQKEAAA